MEAILSRKRGRCGAQIQPRTEQKQSKCAAICWILLNKLESSVLFDEMSEATYWN